MKYLWRGEMVDGLILITAEGAYWLKPHQGLTYDRTLAHVYGKVLANEGVNFRDILDDRKRRTEQRRHGSYGVFDTVEGANKR